MSYNSSIFDDKISVLAQLETLKQTVEQDDEIIKTTAEKTADLEIEQNSLKRRVSDLETEAVPDLINKVSALEDQDARALKVPTTQPIATQLVGVNNNNDQEMITLGSGLILEDKILSAAGGSKQKYNEIPQPIEFEFFQGAETDNPWYGPENTAYTPNFVQPTLTIDYLGSIFNDTNKYCEAKIVFRDAYGDSNWPNIATIYIADRATSVSVMDRGDYGSMGNFTFGLSREDGNWKLYCQATYGVQPIILGVFLGERFDPTYTNPDL